MKTERQKYAGKWFQRELSTVANTAPMSDLRPLSPRRRLMDKGTYYEFGKGRVEKSPSWDPFFYDPVNLEKLGTFMAALAARYDGNPNVEFIDVGTYGMWGEGHTHMSSKQDTIERQKLHIDLHLKHFKNTQLCISDDFAGYNKPGARFLITDYALSKGVTIRDDSILVGRPPHSWYHAEMAQPFWPNLVALMIHRKARGRGKTDCVSARVIAPPFDRALKQEQIL